MSAAAIITLIMGSISTISAIVTPLIVARRAAAAAAAAQAAAAQAAATAALGLPPGSVVMPGVPMPAAVVGANALPAQLAPATHGVSAPGILALLVQELSTHNAGDVFGKLLGGAVPGLPAAPSTLATLVPVLVQLAPTLLDALKLFVPPATAPAA